MSFDPRVGLVEGRQKKSFLRYFPCSSGAGLQQTNQFFQWERQKNVKVNALRVYLIYALLHTEKALVAAAIFSEEKPRKLLVSNPATDHRSSWYRWVG